MKKTSLIITMLILLSLTILLNMAYAGDAIIQVDPQISTVEVEETFTVNVTVNDVINLAVWEFQLYYINTILNCTNTAEGPFLKQGGNTFFASQINNTYNATHGRLLTGATLIGPVPGVNGSGTLATVTFQAIGGGDTPLHLTATTLEDSSEPPRNPITHTTIDGAVHVAGGVIHDVAVTNVATSKTIVGQGYNLSIYVTAENQGGFSETLNITVYANLTSTGKLEITLNPEENKTLTFTWNTVGFAKGNYTISVYATPVTGETDISDNTLIGGWVFVSIPGDVDGDRDVDIYDVVKITGIYYSEIGDPSYKANSDMDSNGVINIYDVVICTSHYLQSW